MGLDFYPNEKISGSFVTLRIEAVGGDLDRVVCRYPRSFLNEMAKQLTVEIENALGVEGLAESSVELIMAFAPDTYLEHISENVTYRRLMLVDKVSAPRDFWIKWTRLSGETSEYSDTNIRFELGEDVEQKIREREYRYLIASGTENFHNSMSRKKVTEWREVVKRAAKRGELLKIESDFELSPEIFELEAKIANLLGKTDIPARAPEVEEPAVVHADQSEYELALAKMRQVVDAASEEENAECGMQNAELDDEEIEAEVIEEAIPLFMVADEEPEIEQAEEIEESEEIEEVYEAEEILAEEEIFAPIVEEICEPVLEIPEPVEEIEEPAPEIDEPVEEVVQPAEEIIETIEIPVAEPVAELEEKEIITPIADRVANIRAEIETKIRLEYESKARIKAEEELIALRIEYHSFKTESEALLSAAKREIERLRLEYQAFVQETNNREMRRRSAEAQRIAEEKELRSQIEAQLREEAKERERYQEEARTAIEEKRRLEAEHARIARQREEEALIEEENRRRLEEEMMQEALRQAEERANAERIRREEEEVKAAPVAMPDMSTPQYAYTSKVVKLLFRRSVDPNITTRIHEIIKATVEYYGKDNVYLKIKAMVTDSQTVVLEFEEIPLEEMALLGNIIKILGNSGLGIAKAIIE